MRPHYWSLIGLFLDIVGVSLLSVEAIKLENVRKLRAHLLSPFHDWVKPQTLHFVDDDETSNVETVANSYPFALWFLTHGGSGAVALIVIGLLIQRVAPTATLLITQWFIDLAWCWKVLLMIPLPVVLISLGELCHYSIIWLTGGFVRTANLIDRKTPDGTIGLIGLALALLGFVLQFVGTWLSGLA